MAAPAKSTALCKPAEDEALTQKQKQCLEVTQAIHEHLKEDDLFKVMPFMFMTHKFVKNKPLGFDLQMLPTFMLTNYSLLNKYPDKEYQTHFAAINSVTPMSQANRKSLEPGDIVVRVNEVDVWKMRSWAAAHAALSDARTKGDGQLTVTFAREMDSSFFGEVISEDELKQNLVEDCTVKAYPPYQGRPTTRLIPMRAYDLKNGMWCLDDETGLPGTVSDLKWCSLNGCATFRYSYKLSMPHSGRETWALHNGGDHLLRPVTENVEYLVSHMDGDDDLVCLDEDFEEIFFKLSPELEDLYANVTETIQSGQDEGKEVYVTVFEVPMKVNHTIKILQTVTGVKAVDP